MTEAYCRCRTLNRGDSYLSGILAFKRTAASNSGCTNISLSSLYKHLSVLPLGYYLCKLI